MLNTEDAQVAQQILSEALVGGQVSSSLTSLTVLSWTPPTMQTWTSTEIQAKETAERESQQLTVQSDSGLASDGDASDAVVVVIVLVTLLGFTCAALAAALFWRRLVNQRWLRTSRMSKSSTRTAGSKVLESERHSHIFEGFDVGLKDAYPQLHEDSEVGVVVPHSLPRPGCVLDIDKPEESGMAYTAQGKLLMRCSLAAEPGQRTRSHRGLHVPEEEAEQKRGRRGSVEGPPSMRGVRVAQSSSTSASCAAPTAIQKKSVAAASAQTVRV